MALKSFGDSSSEKFPAKKNENFIINYESDTSVNEELLVSASIDLLYDGMVVNDDIYDSSADRKLVSIGTTLDEYQIERIKRLNTGSGTIYVTARTHKAMLTKRPKNVEIEARREVEEASGYSKTKDETLKYLGKIANEKTVDLESLEIIAGNVTNKLDSMSQDSCLFLINAMAPVNEYLHRHSINVGMLNGLAGRWMEMDDAQVNKLILIGLLHDIGMVEVPNAILNAPRKLTVVEYEVIKTHVAHVEDLLSDFPNDIRIAASSHHERCDGTGYNNRYRHEEILLEARITAVSDTYDAIVSHSSYKKPQSPFHALAILKEQSGTALDADVVRAFVENIPADLVGKPVMMSDGTIGIVREYDPEDIAFPMVELSGQIIKTNKNLFCESMFNDD